MSKELLELAAKAAGYTIQYREGYNPCVVDSKDENDELGVWNPLNYDGDAFRLAVKMGVVIRPLVLAGVVGAAIPPSLAIVEYFADHNGDKYAATRMAIVKAVAAMASQDLKEATLDKQEHYKEVVKSFGTQDEVYGDTVFINPDLGQGKTQLETYREVAALALAAGELSEPKQLPTRAVLLVDAMPLYVTSIGRDKAGRPLSGFVQNGEWALLLNHEFKTASAAGIKSWSFKEVREVHLPESVTGDYNAIIDWATDRLGAK